MCLQKQYATAIQLCMQNVCNNDMTKKKKRKIKKKYIAFQGRSAVIATYILCGFGSIAAMGINLGALTAAEPSRRKDYAKGMFRAFVCGNVACFMTACIAGMYQTC